jgi:cellulose synthase/poly-beta-1,6-N-acetylglucosamine synthase-like glycosyltransferase
MQASIIVSYYKNLSNLEIILHALNNQTAKNSFEVIVSEDDDDLSTKQFLNTIKSNLNYPITHTSQKDEGFQKCKSLNNAIKISSTDFLIFIDGDCIPHKKFVANYINSKKERVVLFGRRVVLSESLSKKIIAKKEFSFIALLNLMIFKCKRIEDSIYFPFINKWIKKKKASLLLGCNMGINKADLMAINGFDEDYIFPGGGEDSDIEWRLKKIEGIQFKSMRFMAIVYHLYHTERFNKEQEIERTEFMNKKINAGYFFCKNGLTKTS